MICVLNLLSTEVPDMKFILLLLLALNLQAFPVFYPKRPFPFNNYYIWNSEKKERVKPVEEVREEVVQTHGNTNLLPIALIMIEVGLLLIAGSMKK